MTTTTPTIDLWSSRSFAAGHPTEQYRWLRENSPVHRHEEPGGRGFWAVTRYAHVKQVSRDFETFSNYYGMNMFDFPAEELEFVRNMMMFMDPPKHSAYRKLVAGQFVPRQAESWEDAIVRQANDIVDEVCERGECDLVVDVIGKLPSYVIAQLLGIPREEGARLYELTEIMHAAQDAVTDEERGAAIGEMLGNCLQIREAKLTDPGDDLATRLVHAEVDGDRLSAEQFQWFVLLLINAGGDTVRNMLGGGMLALLARPDVLDRLRSDLDGLLPGAIEEMLRFQSPVVHMRRTALRDCVIGDQAIAEGDKVLIYYGAANRDAEIFRDPEEFDIDRSPNPHMAFGAHGPHYCLGSHFARIEAGAMLRQTLTRLPELTVTAEPTWLASNFISGPTHVPVTFTPTRRSR